jgi:hypothetical protein
MIKLSFRTGFFPCILSSFIDKQEANQPGKQRRSFFGICIIQQSLPKEKLHWNQMSNPPPVVPKLKKPKISREVV